MIDRDGTRRCPARECKAPADVLLEGRWTCPDHICRGRVTEATFEGRTYTIPDIWLMGFCEPRGDRDQPRRGIVEGVAWWAWQTGLAELEDHRPGEPFEAEADGIGPSRLPRFARKR